MIGLSALKILQDSSLKVDHYLAGKISFETVNTRIQDFMFKFENISHVSSTWTAKKRNDVIELQLTLNELEKELGKRWNTMRDDITVENSKGGEASTSEQDLNNTIRSENRGTEQKEKEGPKTPKKKMTFKRASPKSKLLEKLKCSLCDKAYESLKALKLHAKNHHNGEGVGVDVKEIQNQNKVTCMICQSKCQRDLVTRHLIQVHGFKKPGKNSVFRGFITLNNYDWKPLWLKNHEDDPPEEVLLRADEEGRVSLYGVIFEADEVANVTGDHDSRENSGGRDGARPKIDKTIQSKEVMKKKTRPEEESAPPRFMRALFPTESSPCDLLENLRDMHRSPTVHMVRDILQEETENDNQDLKKKPCEDGKKLIPKDVGDSGVNVEVFDVQVKDGELWSSEIDDGDSDFDYTDSVDENELRKHNKEVRKAKRNNVNSRVDLPKLDKNASVIEDFEKYLNHKKKGTCSDPSKLSSNLKTRGHLYLYQDSFLAFESKRNQKFNLKSLISPLAEDFVELSDPTEVDGWLDSISGDDGNTAPGRRREMLKAHVQFRNYLLDKLSKQDFGKSAGDYFKRDMVLRNLNSIKTKIENDKVFQKLSKLEEKLRKEREKARSILFPEKIFNELNCVSTWFDSEKAKEEEAECDKIYEKCMAGRKVSEKEFSKFAHWARWTVACEDRNRTSAYKFTNLEFMQRKEKWLPDVKKGDTSSDLERFDNLPSTWDADSPPSEGAPPSCWVITVTSADLKGQEDAQLVLTRRGLESCVRFREMKNECLEKEDNNGHFFVNKKGKPLGRMQRTKGSIIEKFASASGVQKATVNTLRRAAESQIQSSPTMKQNVEKLQLHSSSVGLKHYDRTAPNTRASFVAQLSNIESPNKADKEVPSDIKKRRKERDAKDKEAIIKDAQKVLKRQKLERKPMRSKNAKISFNERDILQKIFSVQVKEKYNGIFPGKLSVHL